MLTIAFGVVHCYFFFLFFSFPFRSSLIRGCLKGECRIHYIVKPLPLFFSVCVCVYVVRSERKRKGRGERIVCGADETYLFVCVCVCVFQLFYDTTYFRSRQTAKSVCEEARFLLVKSRMVKTTTKTLIEKRGQVLKQLPCYWLPELFFFFLLCVFLLLSISLFSEPILYSLSLSLSFPDSLLPPPLYYPPLSYFHFTCATLYHKSTVERTGELF